MFDAKILKNAPAGATHWDKLQYYRIRFNDSSLNVAWDVFNQVTRKWDSAGDITHVYKVRSLADIKVIESLRSQLATAKADGIREAVKSSVQWDCFEISLCTAEKVEEWSWIKTERLLDFANQLNKEQGE